MKDFYEGINRSRLRSRLDLLYNHADGFGWVFTQKPLLNIQSAHSWWFAIGLLLVPHGVLCFLLDGEGKSMCFHGIEPPLDKKCDCAVVDG